MFHAKQVKGNSQKTLGKESKKSAFKTDIMPLIFE